MHIEVWRWLVKWKGFGLSQNRSMNIIPITLSVLKPCDFPDHVKRTATWSPWFSDLLQQDSTILHKLSSKRGAAHRQIFFPCTKGGEVKLSRNFASWRLPFCSCCISTLRFIVFITVHRFLIFLGYLINMYVIRYRISIHNLYLIEWWGTADVNDRAVYDNCDAH